MQLIKRNINSEEPDDHWGFLNPKNKTVLDLGCAKFFSKISTAEWFVNKGSIKVVGVDTHDIGYSHENFIMKIKTISSSDHLRSLIDEFLPEIIKCDIEGAEIYFEKLLLPICVTDFAVEYHDEKTKLSIENSIASWGFTNIEYYTLLGHSINRIGVIHVWK